MHYCESLSSSAARNSHDIGTAFRTDPGKRIAIALFRFFPYGGLSRDMLRIAREFQKRGHDVTVFAGRWDGAIPSDLKVVVLDSNGLTNHGRAAAFSRAFAAVRDSFDFVLGFNRMEGLDAYFAADVCYAEAVSRKPPLKRIIYRLMSRCRTFLRLEQSVFGHDSRTRILFLDESARDAYRKHYDLAGRETHILPPGVDPAFSPALFPDEEKHSQRRAIGIADDEILFLHVGSDFRRKGVDRAIRTIAFLRSRTASDREFRLVIVGKGSKEIYEELALKLGVADRVRFMPAMTDASSLMAASDVLIHPARSENTGTVIVEAMALGVPVICSAACGFAHYVRDAGAGLVVDGLTEQSFQNALNGACREGLSPAVRQKWEEGARRFSGMRPKTAMAVDAVDWLERFVFHEC